MVAIFTFSLWKTWELNASDRRNRLIDVLVVGSVINQGLVDVSFERVDEILLVRAVSLACKVSSSKDGSYGQVNYA